MKVQCSCGAKSVFDITSEMHSHPVRFTCPACGQDASEFVDGLIRQELGQNATPPGRVTQIDARLESPAPSPPSPPAPVPASQPRVVSSTKPVAISISARSTPLSIHKASVAPPAESPASTAPAETEELTHCPKHPSELARETCRICGKPICIQCMDLFGYFCSPFCKGKASTQGLDVPVYRSKKKIGEQRVWRRTVWLTSAAVILLVGTVAFWFWHWFAAAPKQILSIRFPEPAYSGQSTFAGREQLIFLRGGTLARYDMRQNKQLWSSYLLNKDQIKREVDRQIQQTKRLIDKANNEAWEHVPKMPDPEKLAQTIERGEAASLKLWVRGQNIWVLTSEKITRYDWESGKTVQEVKFPEGNMGLICRGDELLSLQNDSGKSEVLSVNLTSCDSHTTELQGQPKPKTEPPKNPTVAGSSKPSNRNIPKAGLPTGMPGRDAGKVMDPAKVAAQAQKLSFPERLALPAILANSWSQERTLAQLDEDERGRNRAPVVMQPLENVTLIPTTDGFIEFSSRMVERKTITHSTLAPKPAKSVLEGPVNVTQSAEVANEILNEMQRERGGGFIEEDVSRYAVKLRRAGSEEAWNGEVIGPPSLLPLQTVNVLAANKTIIVFDKNNKKLWETTLNFNLGADSSGMDLDSSANHGPCVEHKNTLYVFDAGVLSAFDLKTGNARWRLPSVGVVSLFFDDSDMLYVNTTTGNPSQIKNAHQIDITRKITPIVLKVSPTNGKILWSSQTVGLVSYVSGKYIYTVQSYQPEEEEENPYRQETGFEIQPHLRIKRVNPKNGHEMWEHFQQRAPLDVQFDKNYLRLVFKKEVQVLRCMTW